jgi:predicted molibdopterin-dependent oxidoreductase YjgC
MYAGISYQRLLSRESVLQPAGMPDNPLPSQLYPTEGGQNFGVQWPSASPDDPGVSILYAQDSHARKHKLLPMEIKGVPAMTTPDYPLLFLPGRVLQQPQRGIEIEVIGEKNHIQRDEILQLHPSDAASLGIGEGEWVEAISARERVRAKAHISEATTPKTVSATFLFGELAARLEESDDPDPMSKVPTLDMAPVRVAQAEG